MPETSFISIAEQVTERLRGEISRGRWSGVMPGRNQLAAELGINFKTVEIALRQLERDGLLVSQGAGRRRRIVSQAAGAVVRPLRVGILLCDTLDRHLEYIVELQHELVEAGHAPVFAPKVLTELRFDVKRVARLVGQTRADAWVVAGGSREVLEWFVANSVPAFALFRHRRDLPIAGTGPEKLPALIAATRALIDLGHQRIVLILRHIHRRPQPGVLARAFLETLEAGRIQAGDYNLPDWEESPEGFQACLTALFRVTPPTAMIISEPALVAAAQQFLGRRRIRVPEDVSLISTDPDPHFPWSVPSIAHIRWDSLLVVRHILRWAANVSRGRPGGKQSFVAAEYVPGGTVGPVPSD